MLYNNNNNNNNMIIRVCIFDSIVHLIHFTTSAKVLADKTDTI